MEDFIGNQAILSVLYGAAKTKKPAGCYILAGEEGSGKRSIARRAAAAFCCTKPNPDGSPCLSCRECQNVLAGTHVDVRELNPEKDKKLIPVDAVRQFLKATYATSIESDWRAFIIDASALNSQGQNALLKSIEEVRPNSVFFLLSTDLSALLPTVRSRGVILRTEALPVKVICNALLEKLGKSQKLAARAQVAAALSGGSLGKADQLVRSDRFFALRDSVINYFSALANGAGFTKLCALIPPGDTARQEYLDFLSMTKIALRDLLLKACDPESEPMIFPEDESFLDLVSVVRPDRANALFSLAEELLSDADSANVFTGLSRFHREAQGLTAPN